MDDTSENTELESSVPCQPTNSPSPEPKFKDMKVFFFLLMFLSFVFFCFCSLFFSDRGVELINLFNCFFSGLLALSLSFHVIGFSLLCYCCVCLVCYDYLYLFIYSFIFFFLREECYKKIYRHLILITS